MKIKNLGVCFIITMLMVSFVLFSIGMNVYAEETKKIGIGNLTEEHLIAAWYFDEDSGNVVKDYKGAYDGIASGTTIVDTPYGKGRSFDGQDDYIQFDDPVIPGGKKSIRFKLNSNDTNPARLIMINAYSSISYGDFISIDNGRLYWGQYIKKGHQNQNYTLISTVNVNDGEWHDVLLTWDGTTDEDSVKMYIDDMSVPNNTTTAMEAHNLNTHNLRMGTTLYSSGRWFEGEIAQVEIYNEAYDGSIQESPILDIESSSYEIQAGTEFETFVVIKEANNIYAEDINITYDSNLFELINAVPMDSSALKIYHQETSTLGQGRYIVASKGAENGINGDAQILKLTFKAKNINGQGNIGIESGLVADGDGNETIPSCLSKVFTVVSHVNGDVNKDGKFTLGDLAIAGRLFESTSDTWGDYEPDVDENGNVEDIDLAAIVQLILANENN